MLVKGRDKGTQLLQRILFKLTSTSKMTTIITDIETITALASTFMIANDAITNDTENITDLASIFMIASDYTNNEAWMLAIKEIHESAGT
jgi:hypothetical protein